jgi:hypothetical protein
MVVMRGAVRYIRHAMHGLVPQVVRMKEQQKNMDEGVSFLQGKGTVQLRQGME